MRYSLLLRYSCEIVCDGVGGGFNSDYFEYLVHVELLPLEHGTVGGGVWSACTSTYVGILAVVRTSC